MENNFISQSLSSDFFELSVEPLSLLQSVFSPHRIVAKERKRPNGKYKFWDFFGGMMIVFLSRNSLVLNALMCQL